MNRLISILIVISFHNHSFTQTHSYWSEIIEAENKFVLKEYDASASAYYNTFLYYGVNDVENWFNAIFISEQFSSDKVYSDSLIFLILKEIDIFDLRSFDEPISRLPKLIYVSDTIQHKNYITLNEKQRQLYSKWKLLERKDQRPRKFPYSIFVSNKKLHTIDSLNREKLIKLYNQNGKTLPSSINFGQPNKTTPYWFIFQHSTYNWKESKVNNSRLQQILFDELSKGKVSPESAQFHLIYTVAREISHGASEIIYNDPQNFISDWFNIVKFNSMTDLQHEINIDELTFINELRKQIYLEEINDAYLRKRLLFIEQNLYFR
ncbi:MAG: hypothetical protein IPM77_14845 [Crocinitomicaceae bacterium]|nr:hypothetical protein [Crocinitomicaceae bacterium]